MNKANVMPWLREERDIENVRNNMNALRAKPDHFIAETAYIPPDAQVYTDALYIGENSWIASDAIVRGNIHMGDNCSVNAKACLSGNIHMGNEVRIASLTTLVGFNHGIDDIDQPIYLQPCTTKGIVIGDNVWIGANVCICDGVSIGSHSVIAAGSIVVKDIPEYAIVVGNPARVIRDRRQKNKPTKTEEQLTELGEKAKAQYQTILANCIVDTAEGPAYQDPQQSEPTIRAWCDSIEITAFFNDVPALENRETLIQRLQSYQETSYGLVLSPNTLIPAREHLVTLPDSYHFLAVGYALECLGSHLKHEITAIKALSSHDIYNYLNRQDWIEDGWGCGAWVDQYSTGLYHNIKHHNAANAPELIFGWLNTHCNAATGMWSAPSHTQGWLQAVNGFYRLTRGSYAQFGLPLPYPESSIDTLLTHCRLNQHFIQHNVTACNVLDIVHPLWLCAKQTDYRAAEIRAIMVKQIEAICDRWQNNRGFCFSPDTPAGLQGTEMWLSVLAIAADYLGYGHALGYTPQGVHRLTPAYVL